VKENGNLGCAGHDLGYYNSNVGKINVMLEMLLECGFIARSTWCLGLKKRFLWL